MIAIGRLRGQSVYRGISVDQEALSSPVQISGNWGGWHISRALRVGSRAGVVFRRSGLAIAPRFLWECLSSQTVNPFPAPATSHPACGFPALGAPVCFGRYHTLTGGLISGPQYGPRLYGEQEATSQSRGAERCGSRRRAGAELGILNRKEDDAKGGISAAFCMMGLV
jgi:hypothetical protein